MTEQLETYFKENYKRLINIARRRVDHYSLQSAEDAVQEAFWRACRYKKSYDGKEDFDKWFKKILHNCINQIKRDERDKGVSYRDVEEVASEPQMIVFSQDVQDIFNSLSTRDQNILNMYFFYNYRTREIHELLNVSHDVVRDVIRRFRIKVRP